MEKYYIINRKNEAIESAKKIHSACKVPTTVIKFEKYQEIEECYVVIPNPTDFFSNSNNDDTIDKIIRMKQLFNGNKVIFNLP